VERSHIIASAQLAIFAAASIDGRKGKFTIVLRLASDASYGARQSTTAGFRDLFAALAAMIIAIARRHSLSRKLYGICDRIVDLILHSAVTRPSTGHLNPHSSQTLSVLQ
jgi:hypothetical protein